MKDTTVNSGTTRSRWSFAALLLIYNMALHKNSSSVGGCPGIHSTGPPASVSDSRSHQPNGDFAGGPCIRPELPLSKVLRSRRLANGLWITQPATSHSDRWRPWCSKGMTWVLCFMKRSSGIFAGLARQHTKAMHISPPTGTRDSASGRSTNASMVDGLTHRAHIAYSSVRGDAWSAHC